MTEGARLVHEDTRVLDRKLEELEPKVQLPCTSVRCRMENRPGLSDNARTPCQLRLVHGSGSKVQKSTTGITPGQMTPRQVLEHNLDPQNVDQNWTLHVICSYCEKKTREIDCADTKEKLHLDLREVITHDKTLPLLFTPGILQPDLPPDAAETCRWAHLFPEELLTDDLIKKMSDSLRAGALRDTLDQKMKAKPPGQEHITYIRVGVGMMATGPVTPVFEFWPAGHMSPKHQHGGCAGSVRVLHGVLDLRLYDNLFTKQAMKWKNGVAGLELPPGEHEVLHMGRGETTWMNRCNWFCHDVACDSRRPENRAGFAVSLHVYKSCTDQFEFVNQEQTQAAKGDPKNDFFWNINLPDGDKRLNEGVPDFMAAITTQPGGGGGGGSARPPFQIAQKLEERDVEYCKTKFELLGEIKIISVETAQTLVDFILRPAAGNAAAQKVFQMIQAMDAQDFVNAGKQLADLAKYVETPVHNGLEEAFTKLREMT